jgi:hypothetical protein
MNNIHGIMAEFEDAEMLLEAARNSRQEGYRKMDAYSPFEIEGLSDTLGLERSKIPLVFLAAGILGALGGFFLLYYIAVLNYPINVAGRPLNSWPAFIPISFELSVLTAGVVGFIALLACCQLPMPYHPAFNNPSFSARASIDRFYLCIEADDPQFDSDRIKDFFSKINAVEVVEIEK